MKTKKLIITCILAGIYMSSFHLSAQTTLKQAKSKQELKQIIDNLKQAKDSTENTIILRAETNGHVPHKDDVGVVLPNILPAAPNAASLGLFGKSPVSHYSGTTDITIPLHDIELEGQKYPVSISYHGSGIKVAQEASWIGLGWALNAGGCITRESFGGNDFSRGYPFGQNTIDIGYCRSKGYDMENILGRPLEFPFQGAEPGLLISDKKIFGEYGLFPVDTEPDIFHFNFGKYKGSLFMKKQESSTQTKLVAVDRHCSDYIHAVYDLQFQSWEVADGQGFKYYFGGSIGSRDASTIQFLPHTSRYPDIPGTMDEDEDKYGMQRYPFNEYSTITAWYLDSIVAPTGDKIIFEYTNEWVTTPGFRQHEFRQQIDLGNRASVGFFKQSLGQFNAIEMVRTYNITFSYSLIRQSLLSKIRFKNGEISFTTSLREDLEGDNFNNPSPVDEKAHKLDVITIKNNQEILKSFHFSYDYLGDTDKYSTCRLMLNQLTERNKNGQTYPPYQFTYNRGDLPPKNSHQTDFWGFYNNSSGAVFPYTLVPEQRNYYEQIVGNAVKRPDTEKMQHGILQNITYPTGGSTHYVYEPHDFNNPFYATNTPQRLVGGDDNGYKPLLYFIERPENVYSRQFTETEAHTDTFVLSDSTLVTIALQTTVVLQSIYGDSELYNSASEEFDRPVIGNVHITNLDTEEDMFYPIPKLQENIKYRELKYTKSNTIHLTPGRYKVWTEFQVPHIVHHNVTYQDAPEVYGECPNMFRISVAISGIKETLLNQGGGLRIKEIYDMTNGVRSAHRTFNYKKGNASSGHLFILPRFYTAYTQDFLDSHRITETRYKIEHLWISFLLLRSSPLVELTPRLAPAPVGYGLVEEVFEDSGKKVYSFLYEKDLEPFYPNMRTPSFHSYNPEVDQDKFITNSMQLIPGQPAFARAGNGLPKSVYSFDKDGVLLEKIQNTYDYSTYWNKNGSIRGYTKYIYFLPLPEVYKEYDPYELGCLAWNLCVDLHPCLKIRPYEISSQYKLLTKEIHTVYFNNESESVVKTTNYNDYNYLNYLPTRITTTDSRANNKEERITYPASLASTVNAGMKSKHLVNLPVENLSLVNNSVVKAVKTDYKDTLNTYLPKTILALNTTAPLPANSYAQHYVSEVTFDKYDSKGKVLQLSTRNGDKIVYLWGYNNQYPIAEIRNATYSDVCKASGIGNGNETTGKNKLTTIAGKSVPATADFTAINNLRTYLPNAHVTTYKYKPLVGVTTVTDPSGKTVYYEYDDFGRLKYVKDLDNKILEQYDYHYKN